jgi:HAMP domain-containing protein
MENTPTKKQSSIRFKIGNKIFGGFLALIILFAINAIIIFKTGNSIDRNVLLSSKTINPSKDAINEMITLVHRTRMLSTNWVFLQTNEDDKKALRDIINLEYPASKDRIRILMKNWDADSAKSTFKKDSAQKLLMNKTFDKFDSLLTTKDVSILDNIVNKLTGFDSYEDPTTKLLAGDFVEQTIIPQSDLIIKTLSTIKKRQEDLTLKSAKELSESSAYLINITGILGAIIIILGLLSAYFIMRSITRPINYIKDVVVKLGRGELVDDDKKKIFSNDEIGEMVVATDNLVTGLKATSVFAENIGSGKYDSQFAPLSDHDVLGNSLLRMRDSLARIAEDDKKRNWTTEGVAKFGEILRSNNSDVQKLSDEIIGNLVKYLKANQGALYLIDEADATDEKTMSMISCYAWEKKKFVNQKIHKGEGLAGQSWQEKDIIYLTDVPQNYIKIVSGLGDANPTSILIVPLKVNDEIYGVIEIASFHLMADHEIEFVKKIAESIASTISTVKINERTQKLLTESQQMTEEMRAQEEEMRQNMEELQATQEGMKRQESDMVHSMEEKFAKLKEETAKKEKEYLAEIERLKKK